MPDYKKGKIYTIRCKSDDSLIYVGSTTETLSVRLAKHKFQAKKTPEIHFYSHVKDWDNWYIELYEDFPCERHEQLLKREGEVIREFGTLNKHIAGRSRKEYKDENQTYYINYAKDYTQNNKEKINLYLTEYYQENKIQILDKQKEKITCECGSVVRRGGLQDHKKTKKHTTLKNALGV